MQFFYEHILKSARGDHSTDTLFSRHILVRVECVFTTRVEQHVKTASLCGYSPGIDIDIVCTLQAAQVKKGLLV